MKTHKLYTILTILSIWVFTISAYISFGFFFDVFKEIIPIVLFPLIITIILVTKNLKKIRLCLIVPFFVLSIATSTAVGIVATSTPGYNLKLESGVIQKIYYSSSFMKSNYDINQQIELSVWLPDNYTDSKQYPIMYVLDGDNLFHYASYQASCYSKSGKGDLIVVGIGYGYRNSTFARGGIVYQDEANLKGRWRDFCFADDTEPGYMPGTYFGGSSKRGKEFSNFLTNTVVKDIRNKYSTDLNNSTIFGHSLGGLMAAYFVTQYNPIKESDNPFTNFVIVDNGYTMYYDRHLPNLISNMELAYKKAHSTINVYRIWGGNVDQSKINSQREYAQQLNNQNWTNFYSFFYLPEGANHSDTQTIGLNNSILLSLQLEFKIC